MDNNVQNNIYYNPPGQTTEKKNEPKIKLKKRDLIFALLFLIVGFLIVDFVFFHGFNLGFTLAFTALFAVMTVYLFERKNKASAFTYICGALSLAGAVTFSLYKDLMINSIMVFLVLALFGIYVCGISGVFSHNQGSYKMLFDALRSVFVSPISDAPHITGAYGREVSKGKACKNVLIGIALAIPALLVIVPLLSSSDAAFENLVKVIFKNIGIYLLEILLALAVTPYLIFYAVSKKYNDKLEKTATGKKYKGIVQSPVTVSFLSVISITYIVYLFSQLAYFFSAFSGILPEGYSYSASVYARRGFFEMFAICVINMIIIALANILTKRVRGKIPTPVKILSSFILIFTVVILITAMAKMKLNIEIFGLSKNRLLVSVFMIMIFVIILFYLIHIFAPKISYMQPIIVICSAMFIALAFTNVDAMIVKYNVSAYNDGRLDTIDVHYVDSLSDSSVINIIELADCDDHKVAKEARTLIMLSIRDKYSDCFNLNNIDDYKSDVVYKPDKDFRTYNYSTDKACRVLEKYYNSLSPAEREKLHSQYAFDTGDYYYDEEKDTYEDYDDNRCNVYSYNSKTDMYEFATSYNCENPNYSEPF